MILFVSVHGWLVHCLGPEANQNVVVVGACSKETCSPIWGFADSRERRHLGTRYTLLGNTPKEIFLPIRPHFKVSTSSQ
jgi:hypothetical protein